LTSTTSEPSRLLVTLAVLALGIAIDATAIGWGLPSRYGWAVDELNPQVILEGIDTRFSGDWHQPAYPPLHYYLLALAYAPALALAHDGGIVSAGVDGTTRLFYLGRLLSLAMTVGILLLVRRLSLDLYDSLSGVFAVLIVIANAPFVYYSKTANLDVPVTFWALLSLLFLLRVVRRGELRDYLSFTLSAVLAMGTKDQAFAFYVLPVGLILVRRIKDEGLERTVTDRRVVLSLLLGTGAFLVLHNMWFNYQGFVHHFQEILWARGQYSEYRGTLAQQVSMIRQTSKHVVFSLGWPLALSCLAGITIALRERRARALALWPLLAAASYYLFFIAPVLSTWLRYSLPLTAILAIYGGRAAAAVWRGGILGRAAVALVFVYSILRASSLNLLLLEDPRYAVEAWLRQNVEPGGIVGYMGPEYYLPRLDGFDSRRLRPTESVLERERPDFLVLNADYVTRFEPGSREGELFSHLASGRAGYGLVLRHQSHPRWLLLRFDGVLANLAKLDPTIEVYERTP
jgi:4-amino-4-deoxy-L-arabinose transferase-like glycosyltransferase